MSLLVGFNKTFLLEMAFSKCESDTSRDPSAFPLCLSPGEERERDRERDIYIYISREKEKQREKEKVIERESGKSKRLRLQEASGRVLGRNGFLA